jgi:hypothetical protein
MWPNIFGRLIVFENEAGFKCELREEILIHFSMVEITSTFTVCSKGIYQALWWSTHAVLSTEMFVANHI